jgi:hypothetical protein
MQNTNIETITTRESYIAWRTEWRAEYKALSREIRATKYQISNTFRAGEYAGRLQYQLHKQRIQANILLELREESKKQAAARTEAQRAEAA